MRQDLCHNLSLSTHLFFLAANVWPNGAAGEQRNLGGGGVLAPLGGVRGMAGEVAEGELGAGRGAWQRASCGIFWQKWPFRETSTKSDPF
jgi:hypothetical protein